MNTKNPIQQIQQSLGTQMPVGNQTLYVEPVSLVNTSAKHTQKRDPQTEARAKSKPIPPVERWQPKQHGVMDLTIKADGSWWHEGSRFTRQKLVDLFATVLWREDSNKQPQYFLKTPAEQLTIKVEDAPLLATAVSQVQFQGKTYLEFATQTGDFVVADEQHPVFMRAYAGQMRPYVTVRHVGAGADGTTVGALDALIHRNVFMHLVDLGELCEQGGLTILTLTSGEAVFSLGVDE